MLNVTTATAAPRMDPTGRRLFWGVLVSLLLHALVLSLQFGIPGMRPGPGGALTVHLAPLRAEPEPQAAPASPDSTPAVPAAAAPLQKPAPAPQRMEPGFRLLDAPRPQPVAPPPAVRPPRAPRPHAPARPAARTPTIRHGLPTKVIAQDVRKDDNFAVPPVTSEPTADEDAKLSASTAATPAPAEPANTQARQLDAPAAEPDEAEQQAQRERLAAQRDQERAARREADEAALRTAAELEARRAADQQARLLAQQAARYDDELASRQRQADEDKRRADQALARAREQEQRETAAREQAVQTARQLAEQQRIQAEQVRAQQLAAQQLVQAEQLRTQQLAEQQRLQAEQVRAQQLAEQRDAEERQRQAQARRQADQLAREQAEQAERLARQAQARPPDAGTEAGGLARAGAPAGSGPDGSGHGAGALPRAALDSPLASRARDLLRGIDIDKPVPQAVRPAEDARRNLRRPLADAVQHDVPLRMYVDSIRQKIERNAIVSPSQLAGDAVRIFPIVSIAVRSDGSIEDVTIVRSSGHADIDEVVRRIVRLNARYAAFPPNVAAHYDVIELRRVWSFAGVLRLLEEVR